MQIGMVGLGKMGLNMARRLLKGRHGIVGYNLEQGAVRELERAGGTGAKDLGALVQALKAPRVVWLMLPAGKPTEETVDALLGRLKKGDIIVDGGNTYYKDDIRRHERCAARGVRYADVGVSGGVWGLKEGYCLMAGGDKAVYNKLLPALKTLAPKDGYLYCGGPGAGHFVKMVHNGIEYGMMSAYGEGFEIMRASEYGAGLDFGKISHLWNQGSVVRSWLLELAERAFREDGTLAGLEPYVQDSGEGRWTIQQAVDTAVPAPVITASVFQRFSSRGGGDFSNRILAALRNQFGGHAVKKAGQKKAGAKKATSPKRGR
jgi:6-phosphogluconate dehydrogenase